MTRAQAIERKLDRKGKATRKALEGAAIKTNKGK